MFTRESIIYLKRLGEVDMTKPVLVMNGPDGEEIVTDGNHRSYRASLTGEALNKKVIGTYKNSVANHDDYRPVSNLKVVNEEPPFKD